MTAVGAHAVEDQVRHNLDLIDELRDYGLFGGPAPASRFATSPAESAALANDEGRAEVKLWIVAFTESLGLLAEFRRLREARPLREGELELVAAASQEMLDALHEGLSEI